MNPCSTRDKTFDAGKLLAFAMFDFSALYDGWNYSSQSGAMVLTEKCNGSGS